MPSHLLLTPASSYLPGAGVSFSPIDTYRIASLLLRYDLRISWRTEMATLVYTAVRICCVYIQWHDADDPPSVIDTNASRRFHISPGRFLDIKIKISWE